MTIVLAMVIGIAIGVWLGDRNKHVRNAALQVEHDTADRIKGQNALLADLREEVESLREEWRALRDDLGSLLDGRAVERVLTLLQQRLAKHDTPGQLARAFVREVLEARGGRALRGVAIDADDEPEVAATVAKVFADLIDHQSPELLLVAGLRALGLTKAAAEALARARAAES